MPLRTIDITDGVVGNRKLASDARTKVEVVRIGAIAAGSSGELAVFVAPLAATIIKVGFIPDSNITGADTNYMTLGFKNKGGDGSGTSVIASKAFTLNVNATAFDFVDLGTVSNNSLAQYDVVSFYKAEAGTGMAMPNLAAVIIWQPT